MKDTDDYSFALGASKPMGNAYARGAQKTEGADGPLLLLRFQCSYAGSWLHAPGAAA